MRDFHVVVSHLKKLDVDSHDQVAIWAVGGRRLVGRNAERDWSSLSRLPAATAAIVVFARLLGSTTFGDPP